ncbi:tetratricopeptide repeat protein [Lutibacter sp. TH_r2]|uniref:tetratricopeptide repeat protein n=1 Tax=Lutibacter sp. TH_r2 TaxID=3082083 RepID=UPI00295438B4|nr:tetratricopeptide repeat protein [Lutibacter sp. TH_r2]MDV7187065.1 tetratricopeptide repeat protein [Lutibacter sp. TH_r2]
MNNQEFTYLLNNPTANVNNVALENIVEEFPYFQAAKAIQLKHLSTTNSYKYNQALKKTAAYTIDRSVLFEFITSPIFINEKQKDLDLEKIESETIEKIHQQVSKNSSTEEPPQIKEEIAPEKEVAKEVLELGKPIQFTSSEPHSFVEWMQLISTKPIIREKKEENSTKNTSKIEEKFNLIDKFIKANPKIGPADKTLTNSNVTLNHHQENESLMTETLAKVYLEQKKYDNAIKAYRILCLKYPEKSGFFADRIKAIKILQRNKI